MATLTSTKIKNTYDALLKATDNDAIGSSAKQITDGLGNGTPLYISTTQIGIGVTPEATYDLHVYQNAKVGGNLTVTGDLTVEGTTTTIDTQTLTVEDPLIEVASNNTSTDAVDIGWYGKYAPSGTVLYAGLFRDTGDSKFKLFRNLEEQPTTTVNTSGTGYTVATLVADVEGTLTGTIASSTVATTQSANDNSTKVATTAYVDSSAGNYLPLAGGTMSGNIAMGGNNISGGGTFTATTFSGQLSGTISSSTTATTQSQGDNSTKVATTAYVDAAVTAEDLDFAGGSGTGSVDLDSQTFTIAGTTNEIETSASGQTLTIGLPNDVTIGNDLTVSGNLSVSGTGSFTGQVTIPATPVASTDAASKGYVDAQVGDNNELSEVLANGNTTGGTDISVSANDDITFTSSSKAIFGASSDLQIYSDGSNNYIDSTSNELRIRSNDLRLLNYGTAKYITADNGADVSLYYNNSKKLETTSTGVSVTGGANFTDNIDINGNNKYIRWVDTYGNWKIEVGDGANNFKIHSQSLGADYLTLEGGGQLNLGEYGSGSFTGTATYRLAVDSSGDVIEIPIGDGAVDGSGTANTVTMWSDTDTITDAPITISGNNATFSGNVTTGGQVTVPSGYSVNIGTSRIHSTSTSYLLGGNVGIGKTPSTWKLDVDSSDVYAASFDTSNNVGIVINGNNTTAAQIIGYSNSASTYNELHLRTNSTTADGLYIDSSGSVAIGNTSPSAKLQIEDSGADLLDLTRTSVGTYRLAISGDDRFSIYDVGASSERLSINSSGNVGINYNNSNIYTYGGGAYSGKLIVKADSTSDVALACINRNTSGSTGGNEAVSIAFVNEFAANQYNWLGKITLAPTDSWTSTASTRDADMIFSTNSNGTQAEKMRITSGGNVLMNCTSVPSGSGGGAAFETSGTLMRLKQSSPTTSTTKVQIYYNANGEVGSIHTSGSATAFNTSSDYRLKDDYKDFNGLDLVDNINVYDFEWKSDKTRSYGVKAHELQEVIPQAVNGEKDGEQMQQVDYSKLVPILLKSIQELKQEIEILKSK